MNGRRIVALAIIAVLAAGAWWQRASIERVIRRARGPAPAPFIVVLPLGSPGTPPAESFFANGLTQELIARLGQAPGVTVLGRSGMQRLRDLPLPTLTQTVEATAALTGSVRRSGDTMTLSLD